MSSQEELKEGKKKENRIIMSVWRPKVKVLSRAWDEEDSWDLLLEECPSYLVNALRRTMIAEVPTLAIDLIMIAENSSVLSDEQLAQKISLLPLQSSQVDDFLTKDECPCRQYCERCAVQFNLDISCPSNRFDFVVTSEHLKSLHPSIQVVSPFGAGEFHPIELVKLAQGQSIRLTALALKGTGKQHAKWQTSCGTFHRPLPLVRLRRDRVDLLTPDQKLAFVSCCPKKVFSLDEKSLSIEIEDMSQCNMCGNCTDKAKHFFNVPDLVSVSEQPNTFQLHIETNSSLTPEELLSSAFGVLHSKLDVFLSSLSPPKEPTNKLSF